MRVLLGLGWCEDGVGSLEGVERDMMNDGRSGISVYCEIRIMELADGRDGYTHTCRARDFWRKGELWIR